MWCDVGQAYELREALFVNAVDEDFPQEVADYKKGFADVANSEEMFHYLNHIFVGQVDWDSGGILDTSPPLTAKYLTLTLIGGMLATSKIVGGIEMLNKRVTNTSCVLMKIWDQFGDSSCYGPWSAAVEETLPYGPFGRWKWSPSLGWGTDLSQGFVTRTYDSAGYR